MISRENAIKIAQNYIDEQAKKRNYNLVLLLKDSIEFEVGWVFFYQSKEFVDTGDMVQMLGGNAPIIINKNDGSIYVTGSSHPIEKYINDYKEMITRK